MARRGWLIYALGGGWGHLTRAAALALRAQCGVRILTNSPHTEAVRAGAPGLTIDAIDSAWSAVRVREYTAGVLTASSVEWLIVDTFPRGLGGELADLLPRLPMKKALIHRDLNPEYIREMNLCEFVRANYDVVFAVDEARSAIAELPCAIRTAPWLNCGADSLVRGGPPGPPVEWFTEAGQGARRRPGGLPHKSDHSVLVLASGNHDELAWYQSVAASIPGARLVQDEWPAMDLLPTADVVVGSAGYNTIYECAACQVPLVARAWPRLYDRQRLRAELVSRRARIALVETAAEARSAVAAFLVQAVGRAPSYPFDNGADQAAGILTCGH